MKKFFVGILTVCMCLTMGMALTACNSGTSQPEHTHTFESFWSKDSTYHWYACEDTSCTEVSQKAEHTFVNNICSVCGYEEHQHQYSNTWAKDNTYHWYSCVYEGCTSVSQKATHTYSDNICSICGYVQDEPPIVLEYKISFIVDGNVYYSVDFDGNTTISMPSNPEKTGYSFEGWFLDKDVWNKPFTVNSLLEEPISSDLNVYAKFNEIQEEPPQDSYGLAYKLINNDTEYEVSGIGTCTDTEIVIPSTYNDLPVTAIGNAAFYRCVNLTGIIIPNSIKTIGQYAFDNCGLLTEISIPNSVEGIYDYAFSYCTGLKNIVIPNSVSYIGSFVFNGCKSLRSMTMPFIGSSLDMQENPEDAVFGYFFGTTQYTGSTATEQYFSTTSNITTYYIPNTLTDVEITGGEVYDGAFYNCKNLTTITLPKDVKKIGIYAFYACEKLETLTIPNDVEEIGSSAFSSCIGLKDIVLGDKIKTVGHFAFSSCTSIKKINLPDSVTSIGTATFRDCSSLEEVYISRNVESIPTQLFKGCGNLVKMTLPFVGTEKAPTELKAERLLGSVFGWEEFNGTTKTTQMFAYNSSVDYYFPNSLREVTIMGGKVCYGAFYNCKTLTSIKLEDGVSFGLEGGTSSSVFYNCYNLEEITIPKSLKSFGYEMFENCSKVKSIYYTGSAEDWATIRDHDESPLSLGVKLYIDDEELTEINFTTITNVEAYAFDGCSSVKKIIVGDNVQTIGSSAFRNCANLEEIYIGNGVQSLPSLYGCGKLTTIKLPFINKALGQIFGTSTYEGGVYTAQYYEGTAAGNDPRKYEGYYIPENLRKIEVTSGKIRYGAFSNCKALTSITIGENVESISPFAFYNCTALTEINFNAANLSDMSENTRAFYNAGTAEVGINVNIGSKVEKIPAYLFYRYSSYSFPNITEVVFEEDINCISIGDYAFYNCNNIKNIIIPNSVSSIGKAAFSNCVALESITIGRDVTTIGSSAFYMCSSLKTVNFNAIEVLGLDRNSGIFNGAGTSGDGITIIIGSNVKAIPDYLFYSSSTSANIGKVLFDENSECERVGDSAFYNCDTLASVKLPDNLTEIGNYAFSGCDALIEIVMPNGVETIGSSAFSSTNLTSIKIPEALTSIGLNAFSGCKNLTRIDFDSSNLDDLVKDNQVFSYAGTSSTGIQVFVGANVKKIPAYLFYPYSENDYSPKITSVTFEVNSACDTIGDYAFCNCNNIVSIGLGTGLKTIGTYAFRGCTLLEEIEIPNNLHTIGATAFAACDALETVILGDSVVSIGSGAFSGCVNLKTINIPNGLNAIETSVFSGCTSLKEIEIPESVESIGNSAFYGCTSLDKIILGSKVSTLGSSAFYGCTSLTEIELPDKLSSLPASAFYGCTSLANVGMPSELESIGQSAFYDCIALESVVIPENVSSIGFSAFRDCKSLNRIDYNAIECGNASQNGSTFTSSNSVFYDAGINGIGITINIGSTVKIIPAYLFCPNSSSYGEQHSPKVINVIFVGDSQCERIGEYAFYNCSLLESLTIPEKVATIGDYAFYNCTGLTEIHFNAENMDGLGYDNRVFYNAGKNGDGISVIIGNKVSKIPNRLFKNIINVSFNENSVCEIIGNYAFSSSYGLGNIDIPDTVKTIGDYAFYACGLDSVRIGNGTKIIGNYAFYCCNNIEEISIPSSVEKIGQSAFLECAALASVKFNSNSACKEIGAHAFQNSAIKEIIIPKNVISIGDYAFRICDNLESLVFEENSFCESIGNNVFEDCSLKGELLLPQTIKNIGSSAFDGCSGLTGILTIPDSVETIGASAFYGCSGLDGIVIGNGIISIGGSAFYGLDISKCYQENGAYYLGNSNNQCVVLMKAVNTSILSCTINENTQIIYGEAFSGCRSLTSITIPANVVYMGGNAFYNCTALSEIIFEAKSMSDLSSYNNAFYNAGTSGNGITVTIGECVSRIPAYLFCPQSGSTTAPNITSVVFEENCICESIGNYAFSGCSSLGNVSLSKNVKNIGDYAFNGCSNLTSIDIPDGVETIGAFAFSGCSGLQALVVPNSVTSIGSSAFAKCVNLKNITLPFIGGSAIADTASRTTLFGYIFGTSEYTNTTAIKQNYASGSSATYYIPTGLDTVTITGGNVFYGAFYGCSMLKTIQISNELYAIGDYAFYGCSSLTDVTIPDSVTNIGISAFNGCSSLINLQLPKNIVNIGAAAFNNCTNLTYKVYDNADYLGCDNNDYAVLVKVHDTSITSFTINDNTRIIYCSAFNGCSSLANIFIPNSVVSIGQDAFYKCSSLTEIYIPENVISISSSAFSLCSNLSNITVSEDNDVYHSINNCIVETNNGILVLGCKTSTIPTDGSVKAIGDYAFSGCSELTSIIIPEGITDIGKNAFYNCVGLTGKLVIPDSVITIGYYAFAGCTGLTSITIGEGVTTMGTCAFNGCTGLTEINFNAIAMEDLSSELSWVFGDAGTAGAGVTVNIGEKVKRIPEYLFYSSSALPNITTIKFAQNSVCESIGKHSFAYCKKVTSLIIPDSVKSIEASAFYGCSGLENITIGAGVLSIDKYVFSNCTSLTSIIFKNTNKWLVSTSETDGTILSVTNSSTNVTLFVNTYRTYYWNRIDE